MKKLLLLMAFAVFGLTAANAQKQLNVGVGLSDWGVPVYAGLDFFVTPDISIGPEVGYRRWHPSYWGNDYYWSLWNISFRGDYHFARILGIPQKCDLYAGLNLGFYHFSDNWDGSNSGYDSYNSGIGLGGQVGFRYFFNSKFALGLEFCGGSQVSDTKFGLSIRF